VDIRERSILDASAWLISIDDAMRSYGQKNVFVSIPLEEASVMDVQIELPFFVQATDFQRWMTRVTNEEAELFIKLLTDRGGSCLYDLRSSSVSSISIC